MAEKKLKKIVKQAKSVGSTKMGPEGEFLIKDQEFRTKGGQTVEPNKGLAEKTRESLKKIKQVKKIKETRPYHDFDLKGKGTTIEPNKSLGRDALDRAMSKDRPDIKPITDKDFDIKGKGKTIEPHKEFPKQFKPKVMPEVSDKQVKKMAAARKVHGTAPVETDLGKIKIKKAPKGPSFGQKVADKLIKAHESHMGDLAKRASSSKIQWAKTALRRAVSSTGGKIAKKVLSKTVGRIAAPIGLAADVYETGQAIKEGYKAHQAGNEYRSLYNKMKDKKYKPAISPDGRPSGM